jgi:hypothetical protein
MDEGPGEPVGGRRPGSTDFESEEPTQKDAKPAGDFDAEEPTQKDATAAGAAKPTASESETLPPENWDHQMVIQLKNSTSRFETFKLFLKTFRGSPSREVGMYRNTQTGEYVVIQGEEATVSMVPKGRGTAQRWKEILDAHSDKGRWQLVAHTHPRGTPFPSGPTGDFRVIVREAQATRQSRQSEIYYPTEGGMKKTVFGFDIDNEAPYWIKPDGYEQPLRFKRLGEYMDFIGVREEIPLWFPEGRVGPNSDFFPPSTPPPIPPAARR